MDNTEIKRTLSLNIDHISSPSPYLSSSLSNPILANSSSSSTSTSSSSSSSLIGSSVWQVWSSHDTSYRVFFIQSIIVVFLTSYILSFRWGMVPLNDNISVASWIFFVLAFIDRCTLFWLPRVLLFYHAVNFEDQHLSSISSSSTSSSISASETSNGSTSTISFNILKVGKYLPYFLSCCNCLWPRSSKSALYLTIAVCTISYSIPALFDLNDRLSNNYSVKSDYIPLSFSLAQVMAIIVIFPSLLLIYGVNPFAVEKETHPYLTNRNARVESPIQRIRNNIHFQSPNTDINYSTTLLPSSFSQSRSSYSRPLLILSCLLLGFGIFGAISSTSIISELAFASTIITSGILFIIVVAIPVATLYSICFEDRASKDSVDLSYTFVLVLSIGTLMFLLTWKVRYYLILIRQSHEDPSLLTGLLSIVFYTFSTIIIYSARLIGRRGLPRGTSLAVLAIWQVSSKQISNKQDKISIQILLALLIINNSAIIFVEYYEDTFADLIFLSLNPFEFAFFTISFLHVIKTIVRDLDLPTELFIWINFKWRDWKFRRKKVIRRQATDRNLNNIKRDSSNDLNNEERVNIDCEIEERKEKAEKALEEEISYLESLAWRRDFDRIILRHQTFICEMSSKVAVLTILIIDCFYADNPNFSPNITPSICTFDQAAIWLSQKDFPSCLPLCHQLPSLPYPYVNQNNGLGCYPYPVPSSQINFSNNVRLMLICGMIYLAVVQIITHFTLLIFLSKMGPNDRLKSKNSSPSPTSANIILGNPPSSPRLTSSLSTSLPMVRHWSSYSLLLLISFVGATRGVLLDARAAAYLTFPDFRLIK